MKSFGVNALVSMRLSGVASASRGSATENPPLPFFFFLDAGCWTARLFGGVGLTFMGSGRALILLMGMSGVVHGQEGVAFFSSQFT